MFTNTLIAFSLSFLRSSAFERFGAWSKEYPATLGVAIPIAAAAADAVNADAAAADAISSLASEINYPRFREH
jgi:hypothetical protein